MTTVGFQLSMPISTSCLLYYLSSHTQLHESIRCAGLHHKLGFTMTQLCLSRAQSTSLLVCLGSVSSTLFHAVSA